MKNGGFTKSQSVPDLGVEPLEAKHVGDGGVPAAQEDEAQLSGGEQGGAAGVRLLHGRRGRRQCSMLFVQF